MPVGHKRRWMASERIALRFLEDLGYQLKGTRVPIVIDGKEVGEADAIAVDPKSNEKYIVEIKAGRIDVNGIRQAYVNSKLLEGKPLVVAKGFSDESSRKLAEKLGVKVIELSDVFLVDTEELMLIIEDTINNAILKILESLIMLKDLNPDEEEVLKAISESQSFSEASKRIRISERELIRVVENMQMKGLLPKTRSYNVIRKHSTLLLGIKDILRRIRCQQ